VLVVATGFLFQNASASTETCAQAKVVSGDTCSNVKVEFNFTNCGTPHSKPLSANAPSRIICKGKTITARSSSENFRAEAKFEKSEDGWGSIQWKPVAGVRTFTVDQSTESTATDVSPTPKVEVAPTETVRTPSAEPPAAPVTAAPVSIAVTGFFDMRYTGIRAEDPTVNEKTLSGFLLEDGAIYFSAKKGNLEAMVDLPVSREITTPAVATMGIGKTKTQVYGRYSFSSSLNVTFGQFDTLFGVELNDSKDRLFGNTGLAYGQTLPIVHSGAYLTYSGNGITARLLAANAADRQTFGTDAADSSTEYGATLGYSNSMFRGQLGYLTRAMTDLNGDAGQRSLIDILAGTTVGDFDLDLQYSIVTDPRKNKLTDSTTDREDPGSAILALLTYRLNEKLKFSGRFEKIDKDPLGTGYAEAQTLGLVSNFTPEEGFTIRLEWNDTAVNRKITGSKYSESRWDVGLLVSF
jgi:hypothetical protein